MTRILVFLLTISFCASAQKVKMNLPLREKIQFAKTANREISLFVKGDASVIRTKTVESGGVFKYQAGNICAIRLPLNKIQDLAQVAEIQSIESNDLKLQPMNDQMVSKNHVLEVQNGFGLPQGYDGTGVVMGIIDEGIDFTHPDFRDQSGHTRIKFLWDQSIINTDASTQAQPYGYGKEYEGSEIDTSTQHHDSQFSHGTHVAGIAAGNGNAVNNYKGVAPKSDLIVVKINLNQPDNDFLSNLVDGVKYIFDHADAMGEPAVINISLGTYFGSHDGKDIQAQAIDNLISSSAGHVVVCSAGNAGTAPLHVGYNLSSDTNYTWMQCSGTSIYFQAWFDSLDFVNANFSLGVDRINNSYTPITNLPFKNINDASGTISIDTIKSNGARLGVVQSLIQNWNGRYSVEYSIYPDSIVHGDNGDTSRYYWKFLTTGSGRMNGWCLDMIFDNLPDTNTLSSIRYYKKPDTDQSIVSSFSCSEKVITVGSYINRNYYTNANFAITRDTTLLPGKLSTFSSHGPTRDGRIKPDITATGEWVLSCGTQSELSLLSSVQPEVVAAGRKHKRSSGTSMASPVVAGIAALYLQKNPQASWWDVKNAITSCTSVDNFTGYSLPDNKWGYGKVNAYTALKGCLVNETELEGNADLGVFPNPANNDFYIQYDLMNSHGNASIEIINVLGETIKRINLSQASNSVYVQGIQSGIYFCKLKNDNRVIKVVKVVVQN